VFRDFQGKQASRVSPEAGRDPGLTYRLHMEYPWSIYEKTIGELWLNYETSMAEPGDVFG
jgi:hypothetical protein